MDKIITSLRADRRPGCAKAILRLRLGESYPAIRFWIAASLALLAMAVLASNVLAEDDPKSYTYSPDHCEFTITFPQEPYTTQRCDDEGQQCYEQISFTKVFEMQSTVNFRVLCNPIDEDIIDSYSGEVMEGTLQAMTKRSVVQTFETSFREEDNYKQAGLVGQGRSGKLPTLYIAQLWIGKKSAFSVEAELIGEAADAPDQMFSDILRSAGLKAESKEKAEKDKGEE